MTSILLIFPVLLIVFFIKIGKTSRKVTYWILSAYLTVLVIATAAVPFITDNTSLNKVDDHLEMEKAWNDLDRKLRQGQIKEVDTRYLLMENSYNVDQLKTLQLKSSKENSTQVLVERKKINDGKMDAFIYSSGLIINDYDFSNQLKPYHLDFFDHTLRIISSQQRIKLALTTNPFPIRQFTGESGLMGHSSMHGNQFIYLQIPLDLEVVADDRIDLQYVGG